MRESRSFYETIKEFVVVIGFRGGGVLFINSCNFGSKDSLPSDTLVINGIHAFSIDPAIESNKYYENKLYVYGTGLENGMVWFDEHNATSINSAEIFVNGQKALRYGCNTLSDNCCLFQYELPYNKESKKILEGIYNIKLKLGKYSFTTSIFVKDYSKYGVGDIILTGGTRIPYNNGNITITESQKSKVAGIVVYKNEYGAPVCVGNNIVSNNIIQWAKTGTKGAVAPFVKIQCTPDNGWDQFNTVQPFYESTPMTGDEVGYDNWYEICAEDKSAKNNISNYPVFEYAMNYGKNNSELENSVYKGDWYIPSFNEYRKLVKYSNIIETSLKAIGNKEYDLWGTPYEFWTSSVPYAKAALILNTDQNILYPESRTSKKGIVCFRQF